jgi:ribosomal-protein-serine acetyltransferase
VTPELLPLPSFIEGSRVRVRPFRRGDGAGVFAAIDEDRAHLRAWLPWVDAHKTAVDTEIYVRKAHAWWILREDLPVVIERTDGEILGGSGLHRFDWAVRSFEIGYWVRKSAEGQGLVTEAVELEAAMAFERLEANRVEIRCDPENVRSAAVPRRLGFALEARLSSNTVAANGGLRDTLVFALTKETFRAAPWKDRALAAVQRADREG